jgi:hypothetical protein
MALVNPNIAMSFRQPEIQAPNALAQYAQIQQIQAGRQAQELNALKMQEAQAAIENRNRLGQLNPLAEDYENQVFKIDPELGLKIRKESAATAAQRAAQKKSEFDLKAAQRKFGDDLKRGLSANPSDANIIAFGEDAVLQGLYTQEQVNATVSELLKLSPADRVRVLAQSGASAGELKPTTSVGPTGIVQIPAFSDKATVVQGTQAAFQMTPAQIEQAKRDQQRLALEGQRVNLEGQRVQIARQEAERKTQGLDALPPKEVQKREAAFPQATAAIKGFETKSSAFINDLIALRDHPGLSEITGFAAGRLPGLTADGRAAQALYDKVVAKGGFQALQDMRDASKTGGALGNVSNQEGKQLTASFAAIDRRQDAKDVQAAIDTAISDIEGSKTRMREAYDSTYSYKAGGAPAAPAAPLGPQDKQALEWANSNPKDPRAAQIKQRLGVK